MRHSSAIFPLLVAVSIAGASCGQGHGSKASQTAAYPSAKPVVADVVAEPPLTDADLSPGDVRAMSADALRQYMDGESAAAFGLPGAAALDADDGLGDQGSLRPVSDACVEKALQQLTIHAAGEQATIAGHLDLGTCLATELAATAGEVLDAHEQLRVFLSITCDGVDLTRFDGKPYGALATADEHPCAAATGARIVAQTDDAQQAQLRRGDTRSDQGRRLVRSLGGSGGGACRYVEQGGRLTQEGCSEVSREIVTRSRTTQGASPTTVSPLEGKEDYLRVEQLDAADTPPGGANLKVTRNNWSGEAGPDPSGRPAWQMRDAAGTAAGAP